jgi:hypothetical protein
VKPICLYLSYQVVAVPTLIMMMCVSFSRDLYVRRYFGKGQAIYYVIVLEYA